MKRPIDHLDSATTVEDLQQNGFEPGANDLEIEIADQFYCICELETDDYNSTGGSAPPPSLDCRIVYMGFVMGTDVRKHMTWFPMTDDSTNDFLKHNYLAIVAKIRELDDEARTEYAVNAAEYAQDCGAGGDR